MGRSTLPFYDQKSLCDGGRNIPPLAARIFERKLYDRNFLSVSFLSHKANGGDVRKISKVTVVFVTPSTHTIVGAIEENNRETLI